MFSVGQLDSEQKAAIASWVDEGADLSTVQKRLLGEFEISISYLDTRFLVSDLGLTIKEEVAEKAKDPEQQEIQQTNDLQADSGVQLHIDDEPIPGCMISGVVTFSDNERGMWYIDEAGRPGLECDTKDYQPSAEDIQAFQTALQEEMMRRQQRGPSAV